MLDLSKLHKKKFCFYKNVHFVQGFIVATL